MQQWRTRSLFLILLLLSAIGTSLADRKDATALREADRQWEKAVAAKDLDKSVAACAPDGSILPPNAPMATGPAIRKLFEGFFALPGFSIHWNVDVAEVAKSGDLGYTRGTYHSRSTMPQASRSLITVNTSLYGRSRLTDRGKWQRTFSTRMSRPQNKHLRNVAGIERGRKQTETALSAVSDLRT